MIAFKTDNPGAWLLHCHIAFHISEGLGFQILERQDDAEKLWPKGNSPQIDEAERVCRNWKDWQSKRDNWAVSPANCTEEKDEFCFQDDSGV